MKVKKSFGRVFATVITVVLTVSMLLLASVYIGGTQFGGEGSAINLESLPDGTVKVGEDSSEAAAIYEKELLNVSFAAITFGGDGGGAHGSNAAAKALLDFTLPPLHTCLSGDGELSRISREEFSASMSGDYIYIDIGAVLPYQILYALSGEYSSSARSEEPLSADRLIFKFENCDTLILYLSDGENCFVSSLSASVSAAEAAALAGDSRLGSFAVTPLGVPTSDTTLMLPEASFSVDGLLPETEQSSVRTLLGYDGGTAEGSYSLVEPHGTLRVSPHRIIFNASRDGGIPISDFLSVKKDELDINLYDILLSSVSACEALTAAAPSIISGADYYISGFYRDSDTYTVVFGAAINSVAIEGDGYPHFARFTVQNGRFQSMEIRCLNAAEGSTTPLFPSSWQYAHAAKSADLRSLRLYYRISLMPTDETPAKWYYTAISKTGGGEK